MTDKPNTRAAKNGTTRVIADLDISNFTVIPDDRGLYHIHKLNVGPKPKIADDRFMTKAAAQKALVEYIERANGKGKTE